MPDRGSNSEKMEYTLEHIAEICGGKIAGTGADAAHITVRSVFTDSRSLSAGRDAAFVAIRGRNRDGHSFVGDLYLRGVSAFIVGQEVDDGRYPGAGFVIVEDPVAALQALAADYRSRFGGVVVGITGSNGKTVVKEWIAGLVPPGVKMFRNPKSYNSQIGVPLSVLMMEGDEDVAVFEAGISKPGEMELLERIIRPDIGVMTTVGDAHQENFETLRQKISEKLKLFAGAGTIIYNSAYREVEDMLRETYPSARLMDSSQQKEIQAVFTDTASRENAATAAAVCAALGYGGDDMPERAKTLLPVPMRLELREGINNSLIVNDSYNSDINSLGIALDYLNGVAGVRPRTVILSDILQSGYPEDELYARVAGLVGSSGAERFVGIGDALKRNAGLFTLPARFYRSVEDYVRNIKREDVAGHAVLLKGNRDSRFERISHALERKTHTTVLEVDLDAMLHNLQCHRAMLDPQTRVMAMIKAAGYGHGGYEVAAMLQRQGVDYLAVAFADEGMALREGGITMPVVVLNADSDSFDLMVANSLEPEIYNIQSLEDFAATLGRYGERSYPVHIKLDTGMHRLGFGPDDTDALCERLEELRGTVRVASVFSHLSCSDDPGKDGFTQSQMNRFRDMSERIINRLGYRPLLHIANSAGICRLPQAQFDMVRLGIGLYGVGECPVPGLLPVAAMRTRIVQIRELPAGEPVGYGCAGRLRRVSKLATIPVGYADGIDRRLGCGKWFVEVNGRHAPTVGAICMDTAIIDVTGADAAEGDTVTVLGAAPGSRIEDMAAALGTIPYEIMTSVSARVKRIYLKE